MCCIFQPVAFFSLLFCFAPSYHLSDIGMNIGISGCLTCLALSVVLDRFVWYGTLMVGDFGDARAYLVESFAACPHFLVRPLALPHSRQRVLEQPSTPVLATVTKRGWSEVSCLAHQGREKQGCADRPPV